MPFADSQGIRIHYELEGEGPALVLMHGHNYGLQSWYDRGYVEALQGLGQLVLIDARGRGKSDKPQDPDSYGQEIRARDVLAVLDDVRIDQASYFGYSGGGLTGLWLAKIARERFDAMVIGGATPDGAPAGGQARPLQILDEQGLDAYLDNFSVTISGQPMQEAEKAKWRDVIDVAALRAEILGGPLRNVPIPEVLPAMAMPCLLYCGEEDPRHARMSEMVHQMPNASFLSLPGLNHAQAMMQKEAVLPRIIEFVQEVRSAATVH